MTSRALLILLAAALLTACGASRLRKTHQRSLDGQAAFEAHKYPECISHFDESLAISRAYLASYPESHYTHGQWSIGVGQSRMGRARCLHAVGRVSEAVSEVEEGMKQFLSGLQRDTHSAADTVASRQRHAADMSEVLARWKKELAVMEKR